MRTEKEILDDFERLGFTHRVDDIFEPSMFELVLVICNIEYLIIRVHLGMKAYAILVENNEPMLMTVEIHGLLTELFKCWGWLE